MICAGQEPMRDLLKPLTPLAPTPGGPQVFLIGGCLEASELDAKRAIDQGTRFTRLLLHTIVNN